MLVSQWRIFLLSSESTWIQKIPNIFLYFASLNGQMYIPCSLGDSVISFSLKYSVLLGFWDTTYSWIFLFLQWPPMACLNRKFNTLVWKRQQKYRKCNCATLNNSPSFYELYPEAPIWLCFLLNAIKSKDPGSFSLAYPTWEVPHSLQTVLCFNTHALF